MNNANRKQTLAALIASALQLSKEGTELLPEFLELYRFVADAEEREASPEPVVLELKLDPLTAERFAAGGLHGDEESTPQPPAEGPYNESLPTPPPISPTPMKPSPPPPPPPQRKMKPAEDAEKRGGGALDTGGPKGSPENGGANRQDNGVSSAGVSAAFDGYGKKIKKETYERLCGFRERHGTGAFMALQEASGGKLSNEKIRRMHSADPVPLQDWRELASVLDKMEKKE